MRIKVADMEWGKGADIQKYWIIDASVGMRLRWGMRRSGGGSASSKSRADLGRGFSSGREEALVTEGGLARQIVCTIHDNIPANIFEPQILMTIGGIQKRLKRILSADFTVEMD